MFLYGAVSFYGHAEAATMETIKGFVRTIVEYNLSPIENGCHALINTSEVPTRNVNVISEDHGICEMLANGLVMGKLMSFQGEKQTFPSAPPEGGQWANPVYTIRILTLSK